MNWTKQSEFNQNKFWIKQDVPVPYRYYLKFIIFFIKDPEKNRSDLDTGGTEGLGVAQRERYHMNLTRNQPDGGDGPPDAAPAWRGAETSLHPPVTRAVPGTPPDPEYRHKISLKLFT